MSTPKDSLRNIVIFSTPLGPQGTASSSGSQSIYPGNWLPSPTWAQHWGILIQDEKDPSGASDTFFELYRPTSTIDVLRRSRADREASETANPRSVNYEKTDFGTDWTDDEIEQCGKNLCSQQMNATYVLTEANCQTLVILLAQRIAFGPDPMMPYQTISHYLGGGLSRRSLFALTEFDRAQSQILNSITLRDSRKPTSNSSNDVFAGVVGLSSGNGSKDAANGGTSNDGLIDLDKGIRPDGPLQVNEMRANAKFWSGDSRSPGPKYEPPPPISLPQGYREFAQSQKNRSSLKRTPGPDPPIFEQAPERFPGPLSPYIKWVKDECRNNFARRVEYQRNVGAREEEMKLWHDPAIPQEQKEKVYVDLAKKENAWLRKERVAILEQFKSGKINQDPKEDQDL